jgi:hypothetical protein
MEEAMLDCMVCGSRKWSVLEPRKANDLKSTGATRLRCAVCLRETYWRVSDYDWRNDPGVGSRAEVYRPPKESQRERLRTRVAPASERVAAPPAARASSAEAAVSQPLRSDVRSGADPHPLSRRRHYRVPLQLAVRVRVQSPEMHFSEITSTINVSRAGVYFQSNRPFATGLPVYVALNYSPTNQDANIEQPATVVRVESNALTGSQCVALMLQ